MLRATLKTRQKRPLASTILALAGALCFVGCSDINDSWEVKGGGYFKYSVDGQGSYTINLEKDDCEPPFYVNNSHHYFYVKTQLDKSERNEQFSIMVNNPSTSGQLKPVGKAYVNGRYQDVTWMLQQRSTQAPLIAESSYVHFDEIINDSLWSADIDLFFKDCHTGTCSDSLAPIHINGRLRYWVPADER